MTKTKGCEALRKLFQNSDTAYFYFSDKTRSDVNNGASTSKGFSPNCRVDNQLPNNSPVKKSKFFKMSLLSSTTNFYLIIHLLSRYLNQAYQLKPLSKAPKNDWGCEVSRKISILNKISSFFKEDKLYVYRLRIYEQGSSS